MQCPDHTERVQPRQAYFYQKRFDIKILYKSDDLLVLHNIGDPAYGSVVHFSGALVPSGTTPPWAGSVFSKWRGDTVLISPRNKGYYAPSLMEPLLAQLPVFQRPLVVMGSSMGGYGALKYSRYLDADVVLAFSPQFSVSPHEAPFDRRRHGFYNAGLHGDMAIKRSDISGKVSVFYDPDIELDRLHAQAIDAEVGTANLVSARYSGHDLFRIFSNQASLTGAVMHTLEKSPEAQWRYVRDVKKKSLNYYINLAAGLIRRKKAPTALKIIDAAFLKFGNNRLLYFGKARALLSQDHTEAAYEAFSTGFDMHNYRPDHGDIVLGAKLASSLGRKNDALNLFKISVEMSPFHPNHHVDYVNELLKQGETEDAMAATSAALQRFPKNQNLLKILRNGQKLLSQEEQPRMSDDAKVAPNEETKPKQFLKRLIPWLR